MSRWLVTQGSNQFNVDGLADLKKMARSGELKSGDMIQPPGASDWMYAAEVPQLAALLLDEDDDDFGASSGGSGKILGMVLGAVALVAGGAALYFVQELPLGNEVLIGEGGLKYTEMVVTDEGVSLLQEPEERARTGQAVQKDDTLELLAKRGDFYKARTDSGAEGWIREDQVIAVYQLGGESVREEFDPLYNPDRYVSVANAQWMQLPEQENEGEVITVFQFLLRNQSDFDMTDLVLVATIKDGKNAELDRLEIAVEGVIPLQSGTMVGTLQPEEDDEDGKRRLLTHTEFERMSADDPDMQLRYSEGVEVAMDDKDFTNATIDILQLRAVPNDKTAEMLSSR